ncbi:MAG: heme lyase CcmF/NrfE family subunit [Myxococcales bacterium]|nr:heme lyase CcmF/NrfE family subunit [Myxococcales bacterium]
MHQLGQFIIHATFFVTIAAAVASYAGALLRNGELIRSARTALYGATVLYISASLILLHQLVTHDFSNQYVAAYTDVDMPTAYILAAFWGGEKGALMFWVTILSIFGSISVHSNRKKDPLYMAWSTGTLLLAVFFFNMLMVFESSPFESFLTFAGPADGTGMNPQLQNPTMTIHPPALLTGYIAFTIPFAYALGALLSGRLDDEWAKDTRRWTLVSWMFLTVGLVLGGLWAYEELGWGGYWAWDPVENAGLIPWFTSTAFIHSVMIQERRAMLRRWNFFLVLLTFLLTIFGTFLTRSQLIDSIHAFADSTLSIYFLWYMLVIAAVSVAVLVWRWKPLKGTTKIEHFLSRESFFVLNNIALLGCAFIVLWGTVFSKVSAAESVQNGYNAIVHFYNGIFGDALGLAEPITQAVDLGAPWFNRVMVPQGLLLLLMTGIGPLLAWKKATRKNFEKNFRLPLVVSILTVIPGTIAWCVYRVFFVHGEATQMLRARWLDETRTWVETALAGTSNLRSLPAFESVTFGEAYTRWVDALTRVEIYAFLLFLFAAFVTASIVYEFFRDAAIVREKYQNGWLSALVRLVSNAPRRYGGYVVHLGIVLAFVAFAGNVFRHELPEQALHPGDRIDVGGYHLTFVGAHEHWVEDGAYARADAVMMVFEEGDAVPREIVDAAAKDLSLAKLEPFFVETTVNSPAIRVRVVENDARASLTNAVFMESFFRERFSIERLDPSGLKAYFTIRELDVVQILPQLMHRYAQTVRGHLVDLGVNATANFRPGSPTFEIVFAKPEQRDAFIAAYERPFPVSNVLYSRYDEETQSFDLYPKDVGFIMNPEVRFYRKHQTPTTELAIRSYLLHDLYIAMRPAVGQSFVNMLAVVNPLVSLLWTGALVMVIGCIICIFPRRLFGTVSLPTARSMGPAAPIPSSAATSVAIFLAIGLLLSVVWARTAAAQSDGGHGDAIPLTSLPDGGVVTYEDARAGVYRAVGCAERADNRYIFRDGNLTDCRTVFADQLRAELAAKLATRKQEPPRLAMHRVLTDLLVEDPANERLLLFSVESHRHLMEHTNCYCGCSDSMSLSQCPLSCGNSREWSSRFKVLLAEGMTPDEIRHVYLDAKNSSLAPGEAPWTLEDINTDSKKGLTWIVPAVVITGAAGIFTSVMLTMRHRRGQVPEAEPAKNKATAMSPEERAILDDELDEI